ncbi:chlorophyll synthesis pathway protein BchC [uncultured Thiodictyon sp.]|uniref:chlorophyll synthesis pathway protein BchC n=1 Tax=uncultured Thiodictyon sp. TaxID=1846217 RepID=UPI0025DB36AE|nr:chlorophyll synthesis pathway protein BchC [uncultured Thiodictyon sp.]
MTITTTAVVFAQPGQLSLEQLELTPPGPGDVVVEIDWSGISTGTERLLWTGLMPSFPGMGYPLVPGYESVGQVTAAGAQSGRQEGETVFVPGANCYASVRGLFGGAAARVVVPGARVVPIAAGMAEQGVLLALAATACHAVAAQLPQLIVGHGVLGRLIARIASLKGEEPPVVWETNAERAQGALGYQVLHPDADPRHDYRAICDVSGDATLLDRLIARLAPQGEIVLAGFYHEPLAFSFSPAFKREARIRVAAEFKEPDLREAKGLAESGALSLDGLITHRHPAREAAAAYRTAFGDPSCLKMILDWRPDA